MTLIEMINIKEKKGEEKEEIIKPVQQQVQPVKIINPFPMKPINSMVSKNGIRLGLYK